MDDIEKVKHELESAKERIHKIETYFKIGLTVAVIFGLSGAAGATAINWVNNKVNEANKGVDNVLAKIADAERRALNNVSGTKDGAIEEIKRTAPEEVNRAFSGGFNGNLRVSGNQWGNTSQVEYGNGTHIGIAKTASCPEGTFVSGIEVQYGGTCDRRCDLDGGIIRNVVLTCAEL